MKIVNGKFIYNSGLIVISEIVAVRSKVEIYECEAYDDRTTYFHVHLKHGGIIVLPESVSRFFDNDVSKFISKLGINK